MNIRLIDYGYKNSPHRFYHNDAGADVYATENYYVRAHTTIKIPLKFGIRLPDGMVAFVVPRSSLAAKGIVCELAPIDSGYRGEIHAILTNCSNADYKIKEGDRIGQLVVLPVILPNLIAENDETAERSTGAFGSTNATVL